MPEEFWLWAIAFSLTLAVEGAVLGLLGTRIALPRFTLAAFLAANSLTHPCLWFLFPVFGPRHIWLFVAEGSVVSTEAMIWSAAFRLTGAWNNPDSDGDGWEHAIRLGFLTSLLTNGASTLAGVLLDGWGFWTWITDSILQHQG